MILGCDWCQYFVDMDIMDPQDSIDKMMEHERNCPERMEDLE